MKSANGLKPPSTWMVRCESGALFDDFIERGVVCLGSEEPEPDLTGVNSKNELMTRLRKHREWPKRHSLGRVVGTLGRFVLEMQKGDRVLTYDPTQRIYAVGEIVSDYEYDVNRIEGKQHYRKVRWLDKRIHRDDLSSSARASLTSMLTVFSVRDEFAAEVEALLVGTTVDTSDQAASIEKEEDGFREDISARARELVKDIVAKLDWEEMQELVAGILRAMGYKTRISPKGPDRGRDVLASPDGLGLEQPRILVEVKHRPGTAISGPDVRGFVGGLQSLDRGLYVSTGGFTKDARYEADRSSVPVSLLDIEELVKLLLDNYDKADARLRALVPLVPIYWPATQD